MVANPPLYAVPFLLPAERGQVEEIVGVEREIEAALVGRVRVKHIVAFTKEDSQAWQLTLLGP